MIKIGLLIKNLNDLKNWELRIFKAILEHPELEIALLIQDGRSGNNNQKSVKSRIQRFIKSGNLAGKVLFKIQELIERKLLFKPQSSTNKQAIIEALSKIESIHVNPTRKGFLDIFGAEDVEKVKSYQLDVMLRHEFGIIRGDILNAAKYGIWSFHHADNAINRGAVTGFWEIVEKHPVAGVTLQQLTPELDGGLVIDKAFFNLHWSYAKTSDMIFEGSVSLLLKHLNLLLKGQYSPSKSLVYYNQLYKLPTLKHNIAYMTHFYRHLLGKVAEKLKYKLFGTRYECWSLFIGKGQFLESTLFRLKPVLPPKDEFWADPFIFKYQGEHYVFFEALSYKHQRGKIACGRIEGNQLVEVQDVLNLNYHLSYPFVFEDNGDIFLMPETGENQRLEIYRCIEFPTKWELHKTAFEGETILDASFYNDDIGNKWLFLNKKVDACSVGDSELYIYKVDSIALNEIQPHTKNPVMIDARRARNGGALFKYEGELYRPSQANTHGIYGTGLNINKVKTLTLDEYQEETLITVEPKFHKGLNATHHLHQLDDIFVIDAAFKSKN